WVLVGSPGFTIGNAPFISLAIDKNNVPYVAYLDASFWPSRATVMKFDGIQWVPVGNPGFSIIAIDRVSLSVDTNGTPYVAYTEDKNGVRVTVRRFNGTSWVQVGNTGFTPSPAEYPSLAINKNNIPYVAYKDSTGQVTVVRYNGTNWVPVGNPRFSAAEIDYTSLAFDKNGTLYVAYRDYPTGGKAMVSKFDGAAWVPVQDVGGPSAGLSAGRIHYLSLAIDTNGTPYVAYRDSMNGSKVTAMAYNGTKWVAAGVAGFSPGTGSYISLAIGKNNLPYVAFQNNTKGDSIAVMKYEDCPPIPVVNICAVFTDSVSGSNTIVWEPGTAYVDSYLLYRVDGSNTVLVGRTANNVNSITDITANPSSKSYKYKLVLKDSCQRESKLDSVAEYRSIYLQPVYPVTGAASIAWNSYKGIPNPTYMVKRSNGGPFTIISSFKISGNDTTFSDANPATGYNSYRIDIALQSPCVANGVNYYKITSNTTTLLYTDVETMNTGSIKVMPNPAESQLKITMSDKIDVLEIYDMMGKNMRVEKGSGKSEQTVHVGDLPSGMYVLSINKINKIRFLKR
ncbi:MAG: T9SS type A sorting domain-containing protein, partial [Taibaiella sp.]|nr:T9SS type A sorting domain-containing protein [Taibaiella sp.]